MKATSGAGMGCGLAIGFPFAFFFSLSVLSLSGFVSSGMATVAGLVSAFVGFIVGNNLSHRRQIRPHQIMNKVEAEVTGLVAGKLVENGEHIEYGRNLFLIVPEHL
jgi:hypothetical protein